MYFRDASKCFSFFIFWIELLFFSEFGRAFEGKDDIRIFEETKVSRLLSFFISLYGNCHQELLLLITSFVYSLLTLGGGKCVVRPFVFVLPFFCVLRFSIVWGRLAGLIKAIHTGGDTHVQFFLLYVSYLFLYMSLLWGPYFWFQLIIVRSSKQANNSNFAATHAMYSSCLNPTYVFNLTWAFCVCM